MKGRYQRVVISEARDTCSVKLSGVEALIVVEGQHRDISAIRPQRAPTRPPEAVIALAARPMMERTNARTSAAI